MNRFVIAAFCGLIMILGLMAAQASFAKESRATCAEVETCEEDTDWWSLTEFQATLQAHVGAGVEVIYSGGYSSDEDLTEAKFFIDGVEHNARSTGYCNLCQCCIEDID